MNTQRRRIHRPEQTAPQLRICRPEPLELPDPTTWSLPKFFRQWYTPAIQSDPNRKPVSDKSIAKLADAVAWFVAIVGTDQQPEGPPLAQITVETLADFRDALPFGQYPRSPKANAKLYSLKPKTIQNHQKAIQTILAATGPAVPGRLRAGIIPNPPSLYVDRAPDWPKDAWTITEARRIFAAIGETRPRRKRRDEQKIQTIARAIVAFWFYTGHRAQTYQALTWSQLHNEQSPDGRPATFLFLRSVKTGKPDKIVAHPHLVELVELCRGFDPSLILPLPITYSALCKRHQDWQRTARIPELRQSAPQRWRRTHLSELHATGIHDARELLRTAAGHASATTTDRHYFGTRNAHILQLPRLDQETPP